MQRVPLTIEDIPRDAPDSVGGFGQHEALRDVRAHKWDRSCRPGRELRQPRMTVRRPRSPLVPSLSAHTSEHSRMHSRMPSPPNSAENAIHLCICGRFEPPGNARTHEAWHEWQGGPNTHVRTHARAHRRTHTRARTDGRRHARAQTQTHNWMDRRAFATEDAHENAVLGRWLVAAHGEAAAARAPCGCGCRSSSGGAAALAITSARGPLVGPAQLSNAADPCDGRAGSGRLGARART